MEPMENPLPPPQTPATPSAAHTRGPWIVNPFSAWIECPDVDEDGLLLPVAAMAWPTEYRSEAETQANARLIASAPTLLAALEGLLAASDKLDLRSLVAGWNGENRPDGPYEPHPRNLGVKLTTNAGHVYDLDAALTAARSAIAMARGEATPTTEQGE